MSDSKKAVTSALAGAAASKSSAALPVLAVDGFVRLAREGAKVSKEEREAASKQVLSALTQGPGIPTALAEAFSVVRERSDTNAKHRG